MLTNSGNKVQRCDSKVLVEISLKNKEYNIYGMLLIRNILNTLYGQLACDVRYFSVRRTARYVVARAVTSG